MAESTKTRYTLEDFVSAEVIERAQKFEEARFRVRSAVDALNRSESNWMMNFTSPVNIDMDIIKSYDLVKTRQEQANELHVAVSEFGELRKQGYMLDAMQVAQAGYDMHRANEKLAMEGLSADLSTN